MRGVRLYLIAAWQLQAIYLVFLLVADNGFEKSAGTVICVSAAFISVFSIWYLINMPAADRDKAVQREPSLWRFDVTERDLDLWERIKKKEFLFRWMRSGKDVESAKPEDFRIFLAVSRARDLAAYPAREAADLNFGKALADNEWSDIKNKWNRIWSLWSDAENEFQRQDAWLLRQRGVFSAALESLGPEWDDALREAKSK